MVPWLIAIGFAMIAIFQAGCTHVDRWQAEPNCTHRAVYSAWVAKDAGHEVRILGGNNHWQAEALIDGEWRALTNDWARVYVGNRDSGHVSTETWTLKEAWEHILKVIK